MNKLDYPKLITDLESESKIELEDISLAALAHDKTDYKIEPGVLSVFLPGLGQAYNREDIKAFLYIIASFISALLLSFLFLIGNLSEDTIIGAANSIENLPFGDFKISDSTYKLIRDLKFPNPVTITVLIANIFYTSFAVWDAIKNSQKKAKQGRVPHYNQDLFVESSTVSFAIHSLILLIMLFFSFGVLNLSKPKVQVTRIEFIPQQRVSKKAPPKSTKRRAPKQSIDSGKNDPKKPVSPITKPAGAPGTAKQKPQPKPQPKPKPKPKPAPKKPSPKPKPKKAPKPVAKKPKFKPITSSNTPSPRPAAKPISPSPTRKPTRQPKRYIPDAIRQSDSSSNTDRGAQSAAPAPKSISGSSSSSGSGSSIARLTNLPRVPSSGSPGAGGAYGSSGNPPPNSYPNQPPSVAARADIDFGPYMSALQRKIKLAWKPPRGTESNRIVVTFSVGKNGQLVGLRLVGPSGSAAANQAALNAVRNASPFAPLPPGAPDAVDIEFTFDYNVFRRSRW